MIDVCLILEGTYPYVAGGVSTWVHQLIAAMRDLKFGLVTIFPHADPGRTAKYEVPPHVIYLHDVYLHDYDLTRKASRRPTARDIETLRSFYLKAVHGRFGMFEDFIKLFRGGEACLDLPTVFGAKKIWDLLVEFYEEAAGDISFLDFFWTWRSTHLPLMSVISAEIPPARIYHAVSTGYAGFYGAVAKAVTGERFFLTEHGIYTHERQLEISQANWIFEREKRSFRAERDLSFFKQWWVKLFQVMGGLSYNAADRIFTLFEGNRTRQILEGADPDKTAVIPNGVDIRDYQNIARAPRADPSVGFIGRVVTIKDVKTFLQAARFTLNTVPNARFYIVGPTDEEEEYFEECRALAESLGLEGSLEFTGRRDVKEYYRFLDVVVLTSLSEGQPYVILEANLCRIPVVATDVGACREMIEGRPEEGRRLGPGGIVTEVANPQTTAAAIVRLLSDRQFHRACAESGRERVIKYYDQDDLLAKYLNIYEQNL